MEEEYIRILESYTTDLFHSYKEEVILKATKNLLKAYKELKKDNNEYKQYIKRLNELNSKDFILKSQLEEKNRRI